MKTTIIEMKDLTDSKEVYASRPNPFMTAFLYCMVGLLVAALLFACFAEIEIVTAASGIVRPNESISTVSSMISGQVIHFILQKV